MRRPRQNRNPLRAITGTHLNEYGAIVEELACGHEQNQKHDHIGPTNAYRRRCRKCAPGVGADSPKPLRPRTDETKEG